MFADGLQDWLGRHQMSLFGDRAKRERLQGTCSVTKMVQSNEGAPAARIACRATTRRHIPRIVRWAITPVAWLVDEETEQGYMTPNTLVVIDSNGIVRGVARSCGMSSFANRVVSRRILHNLYSWLHLRLQSSASLHHPWRRR